MFRIFLKDIIADQNSDFPELELSFSNGKICINISVERLEAELIAEIRSGSIRKRPNSYDLMVNIMKKSDIILEKIIFRDVVDNGLLPTDMIYKQTGLLLTDMIFKQNGKIFTSDASPSDAIGISIRNDSPMFMSRTLVEKFNIDVSNIEEYSEVKSFEDIKPEDFM